MTARTRYFLIASLLVLVVGIGTGLVAYWIGFPTRAFAVDGTDELQFVPPEATLVAFANVREIMASNLRERVRKALPQSPNGREQFRNETGIDVELDIDTVIACLTPAADGSQESSGLVLARGRFDQVRIESLMREHGATIEDYQGRHIITAPGSAAGHGGFSLTLIEPGLVGVGSTSLVRAAIRLKNVGKGVTANDDIMNRVRSLDVGNVWAVGRFGALSSQAKLPSGLAAQLLPVSWFAVSGHVNDGLSGTLRAETRDEASANNLRDVIRGFLALAKLQAASKPELQPLLQSLDLSGTGTTVALSFNLPAELFDLLGGAVGQGKPF